VLLEGEKIMDAIRVGGGSSTSGFATQAGKRLIPMRVGSAEVFIEGSGEEVALDAAPEIRPTSLNPEKAFDAAVDILKECVRVVGEGLERLEKAVKPQELEIEFSLTFDAKAKGALIPLFVTAEQGFGTGLKVKAVWKFSDPKEDGGGKASEGP
jgi:hypothetical protein